MLTLNDIRASIPPAAQPAVKKGEFVFSVAGMDHPHIYGMVSSLCDAGAVLKYVYDTEEARAAQLLAQYPEAKAARCYDEILDDRETRLIACAAIPSLRGPMGIRAMRAGKDFFSDKAPFTTLRQLSDARKAAAETGRKYAVNYSERLQNESAVLAGYLIDAGIIGRVLQVTGFGPHRIGPPRAPWFYRYETYGGILCDIGSHQIEQYLAYAGEEDAAVTMSRVGNYAHPDTPEFEDFGDCALTGKNGTTNYFRVDWFTPDGLRTWGDGRTLILGTKGYIELRKFINVAAEASGNHLYLTDGEGETHIDCNGLTGYPYYGRLILDCLNRTENAMTQEHAFKAAELCLKAQAAAVHVSPAGSESPRP